MGDCYRYIAKYVDDFLVFSKSIIDNIDATRDTYTLKGVGAPEYYLGSGYLSTDDENKLLKPSMEDDADEFSYVGHDEEYKHLSEL